jgi:hypothetical protein
MTTTPAAAITTSTAMIHPQGAEASEELAGMAVVVEVVGVDWPVRSAIAANNSARTRCNSAWLGCVVVVVGVVVVVVGGAVVVVVGGAVVVVVGGAVVVVVGDAAAIVVGGAVVVGALVVVVLGVLVVVVEGAAMAEDGEVGVLVVVVVLPVGSLVEPAIGFETLGPPDPQPAMTRATVARSPAKPSRPHDRVFGAGTFTSVHVIPPSARPQTHQTNRHGGRTCSTPGSRRRPMTVPSHFGSLQRARV